MTVEGIRVVGDALKHPSPILMQPHHVSRATERTQREDRRIGNRFNGKSPAFPRSQKAIDDLDILIREDGTGGIEELTFRGEPAGCLPKHGELQRR